jgi:hypothetical protein
MIEMKKANIGAKYHFGVTDGEEVRYDIALTMIV